ncbi:Chemotaxis protein CheX, a CheY~P-specific phosphatase [Syntrophus gentianae]|uniref:Chemotaxis protein CheX, a CheY~P-specific phosphatase n=1 Tax=Syntrophus gentianae TaxID=43775 RepID=A0A1H7Y631_9BACT|nr:chemotaxis protein CheX [Syntrophus gentianae]SEM41375.1 Chemotaxis protein CheX, a CheY~P-specific phosphatase [Syntrophus gentianae]
MDVKFINPFLGGAAEVIKTMAFMDAVAGKPYLKKDDTAKGDISGIIGITGDATGSLAISFSEHCIWGIAGSMLGETYNETTQEVLDCAGELTNMISGVARTNMERMGLKVFAAIPSVIFGKDHTIRHILNTPSIVIPFSTSTGEFVVDVCIRTTEAQARSEENYQVINRRTADLIPPQQPRTATAPAPVQAKADVVEPKQPDTEIQDEKIRRDALKEALDAMVESRREIQKLLSSQPFMRRDERKKLNDRVALYDKKIRKMKLDLTALDVLSKLTQDDLDNPTIKKHYQHY